MLSGTDVWGVRRVRMNGDDVGTLLPRDAGGGAPLGARSASRSFDPITARATR
jgi:hypothetical protein